MFRTGIVRTGRIVRNGQAAITKLFSTMKPLVSEQKLLEPCTSVDESKPFILIEEDKSVIPVFELQRLLGNIIAQYKYRYFFEKEFTAQGFLNGAVQAALLCAEYIRRGDWGSLRRIMIEDAVSELQARLEPFEGKNLERLKFSVEDVICSLLVSSYTCGKIQPKTSGFRSFFPLKHRSFYSQAIIYIRKADIDESKGIEHLLSVSPPRAMLICNITLSRILRPLGLWKVTRINFFDYP